MSKDTSLLFLKPLASNKEPESVHIGKLANRELTNLCKATSFCYFERTLAMEKASLSGWGPGKGEITHCF